MPNDNKPQQYMKHVYFSCNMMVIKWKYFPCFWPFVQGIHWSPGGFPHIGQWCGALMVSMSCVWTNGWANNPDIGDLKCHHAHYEVTVINLWYIMRMLPVANGNRTLWRWHGVCTKYITSFIHLWVRTTHEKYNSGPVYSSANMTHPYYYV